MLSSFDHPQSKVRVAFLSHTDQTWRGLLKNTSCYQSLSNTASKQTSDTHAPPPSGSGTANSEVIYQYDESGLTS